MTEKKKPIKVTLFTTITEADEKQDQQVKGTGYYYQKNEQTVIVFTTDSNEEEQAKAMVTIGNDKVTMQHKGAVQMTQQFIKGQTTETNVRHPYGRFMMETKATSIVFELTGSHISGSLSLIYQTMIDPETVRDHSLLLKFEEEKKNEHCSNA